MTKIFVTCALPYSNGPIHLGHLLEHIQADIWVRYKKMENNKVFFICCDDAHGTAIMLKAQKKNTMPEKVINQYYLQHIQDFKNFSIEHDFYHTTHSQMNKKWINKFYLLLKKKKYIEKLKTCQFYDEKIKLFLPDRFIIGICPKCNANNQYGDACEICGNIYNTYELINPISKFSNTKPILKETYNYFFKISIFKKNIEIWINKNVIFNKIKTKVQEWLNKGIKSWNISRDYPYFGFYIPNTLNKFFYVWVDALIGYISTFKYFCKKYNNEHKKKIIFKEFWNKNSKTEFYQFIGKDIIYFHTIIFPAILEVLNFRKPSKIFIHGHLKLAGKKMSKSKNNFITAKQWYKKLDTDSLRYYFASKMSEKNIDDINLNKDDFLQKINSDLVNKIINLASRSAKFINSYFNNYLSYKLINNNLYQMFFNKTKIIRIYAKKSNFKILIEEVLNLADIANKLFDQYKPWKLIPYLKINTKKLLLHSISTLFINIFRILMTCIKPILPNLSRKSEIFLNDKMNWEKIKNPLLNHKIQNYKKLYIKIDIKNVFF